MIDISTANSAGPIRHVARFLYWFVTGRHPAQ
jgi:hypothetical protein